MIEKIKAIAEILGYVTSIATAVMWLVKPIREKVFGTAAVRDGHRCLLRSQIVATYYHNKGDKTLREYEYQNMRQCYNAYRALNGNSFVTKIVEEMETWDIVP